MLLPPRRAPPGLEDGETLHSGRIGDDFDLGARDRRPDHGLPEKAVRETMPARIGFQHGLRFGQARVW